jgi:peptide-methionine (S)-S-oxide reductase
MEKNLKKAGFAEGCFWGVEVVFRKILGVVDAKVGYMGGHTDNPTYKEVCGGDTGHAEAVEVTYDPSIVSYETLLDRFWTSHDPTTMNRQGPDRGSQYRSVIFYYDQNQKELAEKSKADPDLSKKWNDKVVTEIVEAPIFYTAEEYHQRYFEKNGGGVCHI